MEENTCEGCGNALPDNHDLITTPGKGEKLKICHKCSGKQFLPDYSEDIEVLHSDSTLVSARYADTVIAEKDGIKVRLDYGLIEIESDDFSTSQSFTKEEIKILREDQDKPWIVFEGKMRGDKDLYIKPDLVSHGMRVYNETVYELIVTALLEHNNFVAVRTERCESCREETNKAFLKDGECDTCRTQNTSNKVFA